MAGSTTETAAVRCARERHHLARSWHEFGSSSWSAGCLLQLVTSQGPFRCVEWFGHPLKGLHCSQLSLGIFVPMCTMCVVGCWFSVANARTQFGSSRPVRGHSAVALHRWVFSFGHLVHLSKGIAAYVADAMGPNMLQACFAEESVGCDAAVWRLATYTEERRRFCRCARGVVGCWPPDFVRVFCIVGCSTRRVF